MVLANSISDGDFEYQNEECSPLSLLALLTGETTPISLLYREKATPVRGSTVNSRLGSCSQNVAPRKETESDDLDLTGSPLRCDFDLHEKFNVSDVTETQDVGRVSPTYFPLNVSEARRLLSKYNISKERTKCPVWALCDGKDKMKTLYLGSKRTESGMKLSKVTWSGPDDPRDCAQRLQTIKKQHEAPLSGGRHQQVTNCCATYCMSGVDVGSSVRLTCSWTKVGAVLEPPPLDATTHLQVHLVPGDDKMSTSQLWDQLKLLGGFVQGLSNEGVTWMARGSSVSLLEQVEVLMDEIRTAGPRSGRTTQSETCVTDKSEDTFEGFTIETRQEVDFTDQLWLVLSRAESYAELTEAFAAVFQIIVQDEIRPFIYARNKTRVVRIVQGLLRSGETLPDLSGSLPLELLVEVGVEKLRRDYSHTLLAGELASKEAVAHFLWCEGDDQPEPVRLQQAVQQLTQLHLVVELAALAQTFLCLPPDSLRGVVQAALAELRDVKEEQTDFRFPIQTCHVKEQLEKVRPHQWQVSLQSKSPGLEVETVVHLQTETPEELLATPDPPSANEEKQESPYYTATLTTFSTTDT